MGGDDFAESNATSAMKRLWRLISFPCKRRLSKFIVFVYSGSCLSNGLFSASGRPRLRFAWRRNRIANS